MGTPLSTARQTWVQFSLSILFTAMMWELMIIQLLYIIPSTYQYSLVVNASEEVFTIDGQVYSSSSSLDCLQGVRCSSLTKIGPPVLCWMRRVMARTMVGVMMKKGQKRTSAPAWTGRRSTKRWQARGKPS